MSIRIVNRFSTSCATSELTDLELKAKAPSIFAEHPVSDVSQRYTFIPTARVVEGMREAGWAPVMAGEQRVRQEGRRGFQKHLIRFRRRTELFMPEAQEVVEVVLLNSHDKSCAYQLHAGIFRFVCSNGMIVADCTFERVSLVHYGFQPESVIDASFRVIKAVPEIMSSVNDMRARRLSDSEAKAFAAGALTLRYDEPEKAPIKPEDLLTPRRIEDQSRDLWTTFNVVQENVLRGGLRSVKVTRRGLARRTTRGIKGIDENVRLNRALWVMAESLRRGELPSVPPGEQAVIAG